MLYMQVAHRGLEMIPVAVMVHVQTIQIHQLLNPAQLLQCLDLRITS